jgi:membrane protein
VMRVRSTVAELGARMRGDRIALAAAGVTYHWFLAVFPFLIAVVAALTLAGRAVDDKVIYTTIDNVAPAGADAVLTGVVTQARTASDPQGLLAIAVALALALLSASAGMAALLQGMEVAWEAAPRPFLRRRALALALVVATLLLAGVGVALGSAAGAVVGTAWLVTAIHWTLVVAVIAAVLGLLWVVCAPGAGPRRPWTLGSAVAAVGILAATIAIALVAQQLGGSFGRTYGAFTGIVELLFWFYAVALAVLVGAELDAVRLQGLSSRAAGTPRSQRKEAMMATDTTTETGAFRCDLCGKTFDAEAELRDHWEAQHEPVPAVGASSRH